MIGPRWASPRLFDSCTLRARNFLASDTATCVSCSASAISSQTLRASSAEISAKRSSANFVMVLASFCTAASTLVIFSTEVCIWVRRFLSPRSFFSSASLAAPASSFFCRVRSSLVAVSLDSLENCLASRSFWTMKVRASLTAFTAWPAAASPSANAAWAVFAGNVSMPFRKGSSASPVRATAPSAFSTISTACARISVACRRSFCSVETFRTFANFFSATVIRVLMP
mmetsp:Transcript_29664/g.64592  ORF Transcript_29664/g.64592 Transcript_29664/m.64592 type:complete len:228 (-) Transcript_29664:2511-3194(-)